MLIKRMNELVDTKQKFIYLSRLYRFGKSMAEDVLSSYYACEEDISRLFCKIQNCKSQRDIR